MIEVIIQSRHSNFCVNVEVDNVAEIPVARIACPYGEIAKAIDFRPWGGKVVVAHIYYDGPSISSWEEEFSTAMEIPGGPDLHWVKGNYNDHFVTFINKRKDC